MLLLTQHPTVHSRFLSVGDNLGNLEITIRTEEDIILLEKLIASNGEAKEVSGPAPRKDKAWTIVDSGSVPNVANCTKHFPGSQVRRSPGQDKGVKYVNASGGEIPNQGEADISHYDDKGVRYDFTFQHADVQYPILSVRYLVKLGCKVNFREHGGVAKYPDGRRLRFLCKKGVLFVMLDTNEPVFSRHGQ